MKTFIVLATCLAFGAAQQLSKSREVLFQTAKPLKLDCGVLVSQLGKDVKFEWKKDGKPLLTDVSTSDGSMLVQSPDVSTAGVYQCFATSQLGVATGSPITVKRTYINVPKIEVKKHTPVRGEPFQLDCPLDQVDAYPKPVIAWLREEKKEKKHYLSVRSTTGPNGNLYFSNITDEEAGDYKYICAADHPAYQGPVVLAEHVIPSLKENTNTGPKKAVPQYLSKDLVAKAGDRTFIYCIYGGDIAPPDYFFEDKNVNGDDKPGEQRVTRHNRSKGRRLLIKETRLSDQGTYTCKITEADGSKTDHNIRLTVISAPSVTKDAPTKMNAKKGADVVIPCQVKGVTKPKTVWTFNAKPLVANDRVSFSFSEKGDDVVNDLKIKGVQSSDAGYYLCKATNEFGEVDSETLLSVA